MKHLALLTLLVSWLAAYPPLANSASGSDITGYSSDSFTIKKSYRYDSWVMDEALNASSEHRKHEIRIDYRIRFDYVFRWKLYTLVGEPVRIAWIAFKPVEVIIYDPAKLFTPLPDDIRNKLRISEFKMAVDMRRINLQGHVAQEVVFDAGVAGKSYQQETREQLQNNVKLFNRYASFNVPESPDWDELFLQISDRNLAIETYKKLIAKAGHWDMRHSNYRLVKVNVDSTALEHYLFQQLQHREKRLVEQANQRLRAQKQQLKAEQQQKIAVEQQQFLAQDYDDQLDDLIEQAELEPAVTEPVADKAPDLSQFDRQIALNQQWLIEFADSNRSRIQSDFERRKRAVARRAARQKHVLWSDPQTRLMWQNDPFTADDLQYQWQEQYRQYSGDRTHLKSGNWHYADNYCRNLSLADFHDWRLPTSEELLDLLLAYEDKKGLPDSFLPPFKEQNDLYSLWTATAGNSIRWHTHLIVDVSPGLLAHAKISSTNDNNESLIRCVRNP